MVDSKHAVWIVATNFGDVIVSQYYDKHLKHLDDKKRGLADLRMLQAKLKQGYITKFGVCSCSNRKRCANHP